MDRRTQIKQFVLNNFLFTQDDSALADDTALIQGGIVDSTGILELIMFLEETWSIKVPPEEMTPANFETVAAVDAYLGRKLGA
jgi:acyl carrier protein